MMTEDEAKTKWCPFARVLYDSRPDASMNRFDNGLPCEAAKCIGSACMAWRWATKPPPFDPQEHQMMSFLPKPPRPWVNVMKDGHRCGYCGLAGKP